VGDRLGRLWHPRRNQRIRVDSGRYWAASNLSTPIDVLVLLSNDRWDGVREGVAHNENLPIGRLWGLARDKRPSVRWAAALNRNAPAEMLDELAGDEGKWGTGKSHIPQHVAMHPNCDASTLGRLASHRKAKVRRLVVRHANVPADVLGRLTCDVDSYIRIEAAVHPRTPPRALRAFYEAHLESDEMDVGVVLAQNPSLPQDLRLILREHETQWVRDLVSGGLLQ